MRVSHLAAALALAFTGYAQAAVIDLGIANQYSGFFFGDVNGGNDVEGRLAIGGNLNANSLKSVGFRGNFDANNSTPSLVVGGNIVSAKIDVFNGSTSASTDTNATKGPAAAASYQWKTGFGVYGGTVGQAGWADLRQGNVASYVDFSQAKQDLTALSNQLSQSAANGTLIAENGGWTLKGDNTATAQIFNFSDNQLKNLTLSNIHKDATVIINYTGTGAASFSDVVISGGQDGQFNTFRDRILFNFANASQLTVGTEVFGSILAPKASVFGNAHVEGTLVANSLNSNLELGYEPFKGNLTTVAPVPEPETYALMGIGLIGLLATRRRQRRA